MERTPPVFSPYLHFWGRFTYIRLGLWKSLKTLKFQGIPVKSKAPGCSTESPENGCGRGIRTLDLQLMRLTSLPLLPLRNNWCSWPDSNCTVRILRPLPLPVWIQELLHRIPVNAFHPPLRDAAWSSIIFVQWWCDAVLRGATPNIFTPLSPWPHGTDTHNFHLTSAWLSIGWQRPVLRWEL